MHASHKLLWFSLLIESAKLIGLFVQVPAWMKDNDQDEDGRLTYKEFKDSVMEAESLEKQRA